ncbi:kinase-like domain-containing protein [Pelagophyceae sp. CCMP2097]|nr:kinase-like domain-containing protein [Pelagophyceae sp. CCMP2097]
MEKYVSQSIAGKGSYGSAVIARRKADGVLCIVKVIALKDMSRKEVKLVRQETRLLAELRHPHIVSYMETFTKRAGATTLCIVMEFCECGDLEKWIADRRKLKRVPSEQTVLYFFAQLCMALEHVHTYRVVHRDLKPSNVFLAKGAVSGREVLKLGDFGISRVLGASGDLAATAIGTPCYMAPEMLEERPYDYKTDVWSLGCVLFELGALKRAFEARSMPALMRLVLKSNGPDIFRVQTFSPALKTLLSEMLRKRPYDRPDIAEIVRHDLVRGAADSIQNTNPKVSRERRRIGNNA